MEGWYVDWLVNMLGHCGIINGCNWGWVVLGVGCEWCGGGCIAVPYIGSMGSGAKLLKPL